jgi:hypothetical protein
MYCDAFLCPCDIGSSTLHGDVRTRVPAGTIHTQFRRRLRDEREAFFKEIYPTNSRSDLVAENNGTLCFLKHWPFERFDRDPLLALPMPVLGEVGFQSWKVREPLRTLRFGVFPRGRQFTSVCCVAHT